MDPVSLLLVQAVSPIALGSDVVRSGRPGGVDPLKSVLKGPLSGPSHREVAGVEFAGWSGNASHTISSQVLKHGTVRISGTTRPFLQLHSAGLQPPAATAERRLYRPRDVSSAGRNPRNAGIGSPLAPPLPAPPTRFLEP